MSLLDGTHWLYYRFTALLLLHSIDTVSAVVFAPFVLLDTHECLLYLLLLLLVWLGECGGVGMPIFVNGLG